MTSKLSKQEKYFVFFLSLVIILFLGFYYFNSVICKPDYQLLNRYPVTLYGNVVPSEDLMKSVNRPTYVTISYSDYINTCDRPILDSVPIKWSEDNSSGTYTSTFSLPIETTVIAKVDCDSCEYVESKVSPTNNVVIMDILVWDNIECIKSSAETFSNSEEGHTIAWRHLDSASKDLEKTGEKFNSTEREYIRRDIGKGYELLEEKAYSGSENASLLYSYKANYFAWRALLKYNLVEVRQCISELTSIINESTYDNCSIPPYEAYDFYNDAKNYYLVNKDYDKDEVRELTSIDKVKRKIDSVKQDRQDLKSIKWKCESATRIMKESFTLQEPYCKSKLFLDKALNWSSIIIALLVGLFIGRFGRRWDKK